MDEDEVHEPFLDLLPKTGWLADYMQFTRWSEAPAQFHFFVGCSVLGAAVGRRVFFTKGYYKVFPNHQIVLIAPTGVCRKTSAINIGLKMLMPLGLNVIANKTTPESLAAELGAPGMSADGKIMLEKEAEAVIHAPELAVFLGKQKYNEGLVSLLTDLFDNPDEWKDSTKGSGKNRLKNVCLSFQGASTPDWLISAIPQDAFGGGFMSRILFIVMTKTPRCFPIPKRVEPPSHLGHLLQALRAAPITEMQFASQEAYHWYSMWYIGNKGNIPEDEKMAGYHERKPDHLLRLAMVLALSERRYTVTTNDLQTSSVILHNIELEMLLNFKWLGSKQAGIEQERILRILRAAGGEMSQADLLRKLIFFMNAQAFNQYMQTLCTAGMVKEGLDTPTKKVTYKLLTPK